MNLTKILSKKRFWILLIAVSTLLTCSYSELTYENTGKSQSSGSVGNGKLSNAHLLPYSGNNWRYFSPLSYYVLDDAYSHSRVMATLQDAFIKLEKSLPEKTWRIMECGRKEGGKTLIHKTHQSGLSVDFMVPKKNEAGEQVRRYDWIGMWHYLLDFTDEGVFKLDSSVSIDFESLGTLILNLDETAKANGLRIKWSS